jgi:tetratricopeptide (TPR) repeat protein
LVSEILESVLKRTTQTPPRLYDLFVLARIEGLNGRADKVEQYLREILARRPKDPDSLMGIAQVYCLLGQKELAISTLRKALDAGYGDYFYPLILPGFQAVRSDPQFRAIFGLGKAATDK